MHYLYVQLVADVIVSLPLVSKGGMTILLHLTTEGGVTVLFLEYMTFLLRMIALLILLLQNKGFDVSKCSPLSM